jgi:hypothetical protein
VAARILREAGYGIISTDVVTLPRPTLGFVRAVLVRDPDGHVLQLVAP